MTLHHQTTIPLGAAVPPHGPRAELLLVGDCDEMRIVHVYQRTMQALEDCHDRYNAARAEQTAALAEMRRQVAK